MADKNSGLSGKGKEVADSVCATQGHNLAAFQLNPLLDPKIAVATPGAPEKWIPQFVLRCSKCTLTPEQIFDLRDRKGGKAKAAAGGE